MITPKEKAFELVVSRFTELGGVMHPNKILYQGTEKFMQAQRHGIIVCNEIKQLFLNNEFDSRLEYFKAVEQEIYKL